MSMSTEPTKLIPLRDFFDLPEQVFDNAIERLLEEVTKP